jgi:hypothetical protein
MAEHSVIPVVGVTLHPESVECITAALLEMPAAAVVGTEESPPGGGIRMELAEPTGLRVEQRQDMAVAVAGGLAMRQAAMADRVSFVFT